MARYTKRGSGDSVRMDTWDAGERVVLRRVLPSGVKWKARMMLLEKFPPGARSMEDLQGLDIVTAMKAVDTQERDRYIFYEMVQKSTIRYAPTEEQDADGNPGDIIPLDALFDELSDEDKAFILREIEARDKSGIRSIAEAQTTEPPEEEGGSAITFRPGTADTARAAG